MLSPNDDVNSMLPAAPKVSSFVQLRSFTGRVLDEEKLAAAPGPFITLVVGTMCVILGLSVVWKGDTSETAAGFWPPAGAALVALLVIPIRRWGWVFAGILVPTAVGFAWSLMPVSAGLLWAVGNCVEPALAALALRWFMASRWCTSGRLLVFFVAVAVVAAPMAGGAIGSIGTVIGYGEPWTHVWPEWVLGDGLGVLVIVPLLLVYAPHGSPRRTPQERAALVLLIAVSTGLAFAEIGPNGNALLPYLILVGLIWAGMRFGMRSVAIAGFVVALGANVATSLELGPFSAAQRTADLVTLQIFIAIALITSFVVASMASDLADRNEVSRLLLHQATHDTLTGLPNGTLFDERLAVALATQAERGSKVAVLIVELDDLKAIADRDGNLARDEAVHAAAGLLVDTVHVSHFLARLGVDEFAVLIDDLAQTTDATMVADELVHVLDQRIDIGTHQYHLGGSVGVAAVGDEDPITGPDLRHRAALAMAHVKRTPDVKVSLFDEAIEAQTRRAVEIAEELAEAIERGEMTLEYQPVVSMASGRVTEFEALTRWTNRRFGVVAPDEFIAVAEDSGFINRLGDWALGVACAQVAVWRSQPSGIGVRVAVNVSARQLSDITFPERVRRTLAGAALPADALTLEITETAVMGEVELSMRVLTDLHDSGVRLSMDDFGTGYSSMTNLRRTPLHVLKIDRSFIAGLGLVATDTAIVESTITLGHSAGLSVVAEGVENATQLAHLIQLGCDFGQGFLWSRSVAPDAAGPLLGKRFDLPSPEGSPDEACFLGR